MTRFEVGDVLEVASMSGGIGGKVPLNNGDRIVYMGRGEAKIVTGPSQGRLVILGIDAPVIHILPCPNDGQGVADA